MRPIADWVTDREERDRQLEPNDRSDSRREVDRQGTRISTLGSNDPVGTHADPARDLADADAAPDPRANELICDPLAQQAAPACPDCRDAVSTRHEPTITDAASLPLN